MRAGWRARAGPLTFGTPSSGNGCGVAARRWRGAGHCRWTGRHRAPSAPLGPGRAGGWSAGGRCSPRTPLGPCRSRPAVTLLACPARPTTRRRSRRYPAAASGWSRGSPAPARPTARTRRRGGAASGPGRPPPHGRGVPGSPAAPATSGSAIERCQDGQPGGAAHGDPTGSRFRPALARSSRTPGRPV
jgi:hypothetical protein